MENEPRAKRTALLLRCTQQEAEDIRAAARAEHRTISGFVLNAVRSRVEAHKKVRGQDFDEDPTGAKSH